MVYLLHSAHRPDYNRQSSDLYGENKLHGEIMICSPHPPTGIITATILLCSSVSG